MMTLLAFQNRLPKGEEKERGGSQSLKLVMTQTVLKLIDERFIRRTLA